MSGTDLWCDVRQAPASLAEHAHLDLAVFRDLVYRTQTKIADLERPRGIEQQVLGLEIPMTHPFCMKVHLRRTGQRRHVSEDIGRGGGEGVRTRPASICEK